MAAAATLTIPVSIATPARALDAQRILNSAPGTSHIAFDALAGKVTFKFQFPGNIDRVMEKLRAKNVSNARTLQLTVPVENLSGKTVDTGRFAAHLQASPVVQAASFDGKTVSATIAAQTNAMRFVFEEIIVAGLMPLDIPTVAGPQEFVL
jgi:hypothetical protein